VKRRRLQIGTWKKKRKGDYAGNVIIAICSTKPKGGGKGERGKKKLQFRDSKGGRRKEGILSSLFMTRNERGKKEKKEGARHLSADVGRGKRNGSGKDQPPFSLKKGRKKGTAGH